MTKSVYRSRREPGGIFTPSGSPMARASSSSRATVSARRRGRAAPRALRAGLGILRRARRKLPAHDGLQLARLLAHHRLSAAPLGRRDDGRALVVVAQAEARGGEREAPAPLGVRVHAFHLTRQREGWHELARRNPYLDAPHCCVGGDPRARAGETLHHPVRLPRPERAQRERDDRDRQRALRELGVRHEADAQGPRHPARAPCPAAGRALVVVGPHRGYPAEVDRPRNDEDGHPRLASRAPPAPRRQTSVCANEVRFLKKLAHLSRSRFLDCGGHG